MCIFTAGQKYGTTYHLTVESQTGEMKWNKFSVWTEKLRSWCLASAAGCTKIPTLPHLFTMRWMSWSCPHLMHHFTWRMPSGRSLRMDPREFSSVIRECTCFLIRTMCIPVCAYLWNIWRYSVSFVLTIVLHQHSLHNFYVPFNVDCSLGFVLFQFLLFYAVDYCIYTLYLFLCIIWKVKNYDKWRRNMHTVVWNIIIHCEK